MFLDKSIVQSRLEYCVQFWPPISRGDIAKVQIRATKANNTVLDTREACLQATAKVFRALQFRKNYGHRGFIHGMHKAYRCSEKAIAFMPCLYASQRLLAGL